MPVILTQHYSPADRVYEDVEYALYHYPRAYFGRVRPYDRFIYYRPRGRSARRADSKCYFGHGILGPWSPDPRRPDHRFVDILKAEAFAVPVPLYSANGVFIESESATAPAFQSAVRELSETAFWKILARGDVRAEAFSILPSTFAVAAGPYIGRPIAAPRDSFRRIDTIPDGAGYVPHGDTRVNVYESAALQERARSDHQAILQRVQSEVLKRGGATWYNNNIDLFASIGEQRMLIEAKSLTNPTEAVDRMRFGIGQLCDYDFRYRADVGGAQRVLAFGQAPDRESSWIGTLLQEQRIGFIALHKEKVVALNDCAAALPLFT
ncbi:MAG: hypothetical protein ACYDHD_12410 [Vulcanimicrobiaceae bacterium]